VLAAFGDEDFSGQFALNEAEGRQLLAAIERDDSKAIGAGIDGRLTLEELLAFTRKEPHHVVIRKLPSATQGLLVEDLVRETFANFDRDGSDSLDLHEWNIFLRRLGDLHSEYLLRLAFQGNRAFFGKGQPWLPLAHSSKAASLCQVRADLLNAAASSAEVTRTDCMAPDFRAPSLSDAGIIRKVRPCFQLGYEDTVAKHDYHLYPPGLVEDFLYYSANNHPLHGIVACDPSHRLSKPERMAMELATIGFTFFTVELQQLWVVEEKAPHEYLKNKWIFSIVMVSIPSIIIWWILFALFTCPKFGAANEARDPPSVVQKAKRCSLFGGVLGSAFLLLGLLMIGFCLYFYILGFQVLGPLLSLLKSRMASYIISWMLMALMYFNPLVAWGQPDPALGFNLGDHIGLGKWRIEKQRFQLKCLDALEASFKHPPAPVLETSELQGQRNSCSRCGSCIAPLPSNGASFAQGPQALVAAGGALLGAGVVANDSKPYTRGFDGFGVQQGLATVNPTWQFVGERQGKYELLNGYNYVGRGRGAYEQTRVRTNQGWKFKKCCIILLFALPLFAVLAWPALTAMQQFGQLIVPGVGTTENPATVFGSTSTFSPEEATEECSGPADLQAHSPFWWCVRCDRGCPTTTPTTPTYDCNAGFANWKIGWSRIKKQWCCEHKERGCTGTTTEADFDCNAGLNNWELAWSRKKKDWCCQHAQHGCPRPSPREQPPPLSSGGAIASTPCNVPCSFNGYSSTCQGHITFIARKYYTEKTDACMQARTLLLKFCPGCSSCPLDASGCMTSL